MFRPSPCRERLTGWFWASFTFVFLSFAESKISKAGDLNIRVQLATVDRAGMHAKSSVVSSTAFKASFPIVLGLIGRLNRSHRRLICCFIAGVNFQSTSISGNIVFGWVI